jgi:hypothetical protein
MDSKIEEDAFFESSTGKPAITKGKEKEKVKPKPTITLKNTSGEVVEQKDYFYSTKDEENPAPVYFHDVCGYPVDREDMLTVFNKIFKPKDNFLFYKTRDKEVYIIIVPKKFSNTIGLEHDSVEGDFQKHAISFISEGSVNLDTLRMKLLKVANTIKVVAE